MWWVHTSDVHGNLGRLQGVENYVKNLRRRYGSDDVVLTDGGDVLQGSPLVYYCNRVNVDSPHVVSDTMNRMCYDCMAVGNHDIEVGHSVYDRVLGEMNFPVLSANILDYFVPYTIIKKGGLRIAILSLITADTPLWISPAQYSGMEFISPLESADYWIQYIKTNEKCDLLVGLFHIGWEQVEPIAKAFPEFDLILYGHDHHEAIHHVGNCLCVAPSSIATSFVCIEIVNNVISARIIPNPMDSEYVNPKGYSEWLNEEIGSVDTDLSEFDSYFGPSTFMALTHQLQLLATGAQVSFAAPLSYDCFIPKGMLTNRDVFSLYNRDSQLYTMSFTMDEIRRILEYSYSLWTDIMRSPSDHALLLDFVLDNGTRLGIKHFTINFLSAYGIDYSVDLTKPYGQKVEILSDIKTSEAYIPVAINSYHANGGGEVLVKALNMSQKELFSRVIKIEPMDLRQCLSEQIRRVGNIHFQSIKNWAFVPKEFTEEALQRDRACLLNNTASNEDTSRI